MDAVADLDLKAYLARIGYKGDLSPTGAVLEALHLAHATHIPFENLDVLLGRTIRLDLESLQAKLIHSRRGGYCFEQNGLFAIVLEHLGYSVRRLAARVRLGTTRLLPRTHMLLQVEAEGTSWICDVGFGSEGLLNPIPFKAKEACRQFAWTYRLHQEGDLWVLQCFLRGAWLDLYVFTLEPQLPVDYEIANYYVSTHPESRFTKTLTAQRATLEERFILRNREFIVARPDAETSRTVATEEELLLILKDTFHLNFPAGTRFPVPEE